MTPEPTAGELRHRVMLRRRTGSRLPSGAMDIDYEDADDKPIAAGIKFNAGSKFFAAQQIQAKTWVQITIRYRRDLRKTWQVQWVEDQSGSPELVHNYSVEDINNVNGRNRWMILMCVERESNGFRS